MNLFETAILFAFGISMGSFLNVVINRLPKRISIVTTRSHCESCRKTLRWYDIIPLFSYVALRGKCRYCRSPISVHYPAVELITAMLFIAVFYQFGIANDGLRIMGITRLLFYWYIVSSLIVIFYIDLKHGIIPDKIVYPSILLSFLFMVSHSSFIIFNHAFSALGAFLFFVALFLVTRGRGMGFGDVKLSFLMGLILGFPGIVIALYIAFLTGACISVILVLINRLTIKHAIPFGPFLVGGTVITLFWEKEIVLLFYRLLRLL